MKPNPSLPPINDGALAILVEGARKHQMPEEERTEQRRSFAYGNVKMSNPRITREMIASVDDPKGVLLEQIKAYRLKVPLDIEVGQKWSQSVEPSDSLLNRALKVFSRTNPGCIPRWARHREKLRAVLKDILSPEQLKTVESATGQTWRVEAYNSIACFWSRNFDVCHTTQEVDATVAYIRQDSRYTQYAVILVAEHREVFEIAPPTGDPNV